MYFMTKTYMINAVINLMYWIGVRKTVTYRVIQSSYALCLENTFFMKYNKG